MSPAPASDLSTEVLELHGHPVTYHRAGTGPPLVLLHGITSSSQTWRRVVPLLAEHFTVIAPDLLGHGRSAKPRGDYSLGAYASGVRDLLLALGFSRVTVVGHSLGGGVAMQFTYQFPHLVERLVLVSSGGLGREVHVALRAATVPGAEWVLPLLAKVGLLQLGLGFGDAARRIGLHPNADLEGMAEGFASLRDSEARRAFLHTARAVMDAGGQRVTATDRLYLAAEVPTLLVWGRRDPLIPVLHAHEAHERMPGSELEIFEEAGHFPFNDDPVRFAAVLRAFVERTEPAELTEEGVQALLAHRGGIGAGAGA